MIAFNDLGHNATENPDILKIVKEDVLRILHERSEKTSLEIMEDEIKVAHPIITRALEELERDDLITIQEHFILLTELGQKSAKNIVKKHFVLENYFEKTRSSKKRTRRRQS